MNIYAQNVIGIVALLVLFVAYFLFTAARLRRQEEEIEGYQTSIDIMSKMAGIDADIARDANAKVRHYATYFGHDPLLYQRMAQRNEKHGLGSKTPTVAVDLDGVIFKYDTWKGPLHFGEPMPGVIDGLTKLREMGYKIIVYTTRVNPVADGNLGHSAPMQMAIVEGTLRAWHIPFDYISMFKPLAQHYIDDRAIRFANWNQAVEDVRLIDRGRMPFTIPDELRLKVVSGDKAAELPAMTPGSSSAFTHTSGAKVILHWLGKNALNIILRDKEKPKAEDKPAKRGRK